MLDIILVIHRDIQPVITVNHLLPPPHPAPRQHSPHPGRKKGGASVPSPGSADSNSQGSYPQSTTPVQFEGPYPGHRQPPPGQGYPENQNYPHQGAINDYGPNHHPGQPPQQPPQQPPSNYGHLGGHLPPGIQQQMSQPPRQQSPHQNRKMMKSGDNNYPQPGNPAIGSHYPPPPHPGSGPAPGSGPGPGPGPGYPGAQHYQYPPYPYHQPPHGQYPQQHPQHHQHLQHPPHPQHPQHPSHQQHAQHQHLPHSHHQQTHPQHLPLLHQQGSNYLPPNPHSTGPPSKSNSSPYHPQASHAPNPQSPSPAGNSNRSGENSDSYSSEMQPSTSSGHRRHPSGHQQQQQQPTNFEGPNRTGPGGYYGQHEQQQPPHHQHLRHPHPHQQPQQQQQQGKNGPSSESTTENSGSHSRPNSRPNSTGAASPGASSRGSDSGNSKENQDSSNSSNSSQNHPSSHPSHPPHPSHPSHPSHLPHQSQPPHPPSIETNQRYPHPHPHSQALQPPINNYPQRPPISGSYGSANQPNYPGMNDNYRSNGPSNVQGSNYDTTVYPANRSSPNGPSRFIEPRENNFYGTNAPPTSGQESGPAPQHPPHLKRHPDFMKPDHKSQHPGQYGPYPGRPMAPNYPQGGNGPNHGHQMWNRDPVFRGSPGAPPPPQPPNMTTSWDHQSRTDPGSLPPPPQSLHPNSARPELGPSVPMVNNAAGGWPMNRYPPPPGQSPVPPPPPSQQQHQQQHQHQPPPGMNHNYPPSTQPGYSYPPDHPMNKMNQMQNRMYQMPGGPPMPPKAPSQHLTRLLCSSPSLPSSPTPSPHLGAPRSPHPHPQAHLQALPHQHQHPHSLQHPHPHPHSHLPPHPGHPGHSVHPGHHPQHPQHPHGPHGPHHPSMPYSQMMMKRELVFPVGSVEATTPNLFKRRKLNCKDLCPTEAWKLLMSLKSGLLAESTWAIDTLSVLVADDNSYLYFGLQHLPGLLETLLEHYKKCLNDMFEGLFKDTEVSGHIETPLQNGIKKSRKWYQIGSDFDELSQDNENGDDANDENSDDDCVTGEFEGMTDVNIMRKSVSGKKEMTRKLDRAINVNIPKMDQQLKMLKSSLDLTFTSRSGKSVRMENAEAHLFVTDYEKKWDPFKNGFKTGRDHWSKGYGEATDHIITHFEPKEKYLKLVKVIKTKENKSKKSRKKQDSSFSVTSTTSITNNTTTTTTTNSNIKNNIVNNSIMNNKDDVSSNQSLVNGNCDSKLSSSKKPFIHNDHPKNIKLEVKVDFDDLEDEPEDEDDSPLATIQDYYDSISQRCLCLSTLIRNLSFVPGNDIEMSKHPGLLVVLGRLLTLKHTHAVKKSNFTNDTSSNSTPSIPQTSSSSSSSSSSSEEDTIGSSNWWSESIHLLRENTLVTLANISCQLDLDPHSEEISLNILDGLLHWTVCPSSYAQDHLPTTTVQSFTPKRLALESLMKLSIIDSNVDLMLATPPWSRLEKMFTMLAKMLNRNEDQTLREFALVLLTNFAAADSSIARAIALTGYAIPQLIGFIEQSEQSALQVANTQGLNALRDNPELMGTTLDMVRRAAICLRHFARIPENRSMILVHQQRLLSLVFSQILDQGVASVIADVIYEVSLHDDSTLPHPHLISLEKSSSVHTKSSPSPSSSSSTSSSTTTTLSSSSSSSITTTTTTTTSGTTTTITIHNNKDETNGDSSQISDEGKSDQQADSSQFSYPLSTCSKIGGTIKPCDNPDNELEKADKEDTNSNNQRCNGNLLVTITFLC
ncbi:trithorax group protein osa-like isoform X2 [Panonychus citri]|uniref:trithorax group protein osa-like isoform X2 n=1 Tax=Panonychus citri TaxID=50023 RepID=UPI00230703D4|nr:trithorax group protein osa-like isoform X2 [Panonychus citri]